MDYIPFIDKFWELNDVLHFPPVVTRFYFYLLHKMHESKCNPFSLDIRRIKNELRIPNEKINAMNHRLKNYGMLVFSEEVKKVSFRYEIL